MGGGDGCEDYATLCWRVSSVTGYHSTIGANNPAEHPDVQAALALAKARMVMVNTPEGWWALNEHINPTTTTDASFEDIDANEEMNSFEEDVQGSEREVPNTPDTNLRPPPKKFSIADSGTETMDLCTFLIM